MKGGSPIRACVSNRASRRGGYLDLVAVTSRDPCGDQGQILWISPFFRRSTAIHHYKRAVGSDIRGVWLKNDDNRLRKAPLVGTTD